MMAAEPAESWIPGQINRLAALITAIVAGLVLFGWGWGVEIFKRVLPGMVAMNPTTAISFLLAAISLALVGRKPARQNRDRLLIARNCAGLVMFIGGVRLLAVIGGPNLRVDQLFFATKLDVGFGARNLMAPNTALNFFLVGAALILLHSRKRHGSSFASLAALVCALDSFLAILGYAYGIGGFYELRTFIPMALHTAVGFLVLAVGIMSCQPKRGLLAVLTDKTLAGLTARRMLPAAILVPAIIGWLRIEAGRRGLVDNEFGIALYTVTNMLVFGSLVAVNACLLSKSEFARMKADRRLRRVYDELETNVDERTAQLSMANEELEIARTHLEARVRERTATLAESEARLKAILDHTSTVVFLKDTAGHYLLVNKQFERLFCVSQESTRGKTAYELFDREIADSSSADDRKVLETGQQFEFEDTAEQSDGTHTYISRKFPLLDSAGNCYAVCGIATDITERARTEKALKAAKEEADRASQTKSEFLSRMSHELRTPMNAILGFAQLLELDQLTTDQHESVDHIIRGGRHLLELINEILDISRIEAGRLALSIEPVEFGEVFRETINLMGPLAADRDLRLSSSPICASYILADRQRLKQVLINLVSNAIKYNRIGGSVTIFCTAVNERLRIEIKDTGAGIPADRISELFTPFARLGAERSAVEGTGLGLAVARRLVEAMDGAIGVESASGKGSTFWIEFPITESPLIREDLVENKPAAEAIRPTEKRCVLYIEDNLSNLRLIEHVLALRPAVKLISARTAQDGLQLAEVHTPDLILLDLNLPDMHGHEVLRQLRNGPTGTDVPVIVVSADAMATQKDRLLEAGAADYLTKPLDIKKFLETLDRTLEGAGKETRGENSAAERERAREDSNLKPSDP